MLPRAAAGGVTQHDAEFGVGHIPAFVEHLHRCHGAEIALAHTAQNIVTLRRRRGRRDEGDGETSGHLHRDIRPTAEQHGLFIRKESQDVGGFVELGFGHAHHALALTERLQGTTRGR